MLKNRMYNKEIAAEIKNFLNEDDWHYNFDEQKGVFNFGIRIKSKLRKISYLVHVNESDFSVFTVAPVNADSDDKEIMANMAEFICRANYGLKRGCFEFDFRDGEIRYKINVPCNDILPTSEMIKDSIYYQAHMFDTYGDGILSIIFNNASAEEAIEQCEGSDDSKIRRLIEQMLEEYPNEDAETIAARMAEILDTENSGDESEEEEEIEDIEVKTDLFGKKGSAE